MSCPAGYGSAPPPKDGGIKRKRDNETTPASPARNKRKVEKSVYYGDYLQLDSILNAQHPLSKVGEDRKPAHQEMLFIIIHQTYELWFKQILHEVDSVIKLFAKPHLPETEMGIIVNRLERVVEIQQILISQIRVLETMFPQDFLEFRDFLVPASGFQSRQFRDLENRLGLQANFRRNYQSTDYKDFFNADDKKKLEESELLPCLFDVVEKWLERTPCLEEAGFEFWTEYKKAVDEEYERQQADIRSNPFYDDHDTQHNLDELAKGHEVFNTLFEEEKYTAAIKTMPARHFSYRAMKAALLISLYKDEPMFQVPFRLLHLLTDMDEMITTWRYRHAIMVQRMIGVKVGTGGSSGYHYLRTTVTDRYKVFVDLYNMATYLLPRHAIPELPAGIKRNLGFHTDTTTTTTE